MFQLQQDFHIHDKSAFNWVFLRQEIHYTVCYANQGNASKTGARLEHSRNKSGA
jgi:hypothetical protein